MALWFKMNPTESWQRMGTNRKTWSDITHQCSFRLLCSSWLTILWAPPCSNSETLLDKIVRPSFCVEILQCRIPDLLFRHEKPARAEARAWQVVQLCRWPVGLKLIPATGQVCNRHRKASPDRNPTATATAATCLSSQGAHQPYHPNELAGPLLENQKEFLQRQRSNPCILDAERSSPKSKGRARQYEQQP